MNLVRTSLLVALLLGVMPASSSADEQVVLQSNTVVFHIEGMT